MAFVAGALVLSVSRPYSSFEHGQLALKSLWDTRIFHEELFSGHWYIREVQLSVLQFIGIMLAPFIIWEVSLCLWRSRNKIETRQPIVSIASHVVKQDL